MNAVGELTESLMASYRSVGGINHLDGKNLPSKRAIAKITQDLLRLLFPGYFDDKVLPSSRVRAQTEELVASVLKRLEVEIRRSLEYSPPPGASRRDLRGRARELCMRFMRRLPEVRAMLQTDIEAAYNLSLIHI
ncbi:MAG: serine acetyltransferase, partial [Verrucomicrobiae bacterium]|nr:serine acetyltransferase [Verrucomicrobiae bacterium]